MKHISKLIATTAMLVSALILTSCFTTKTDATTEAEKPVANEKKKDAVPESVTIFSEKNPQIEKGSYKHTFVNTVKFRGVKVPLRVTVEYSSDKPVTFTFKPVNNLHMGYHRRTFPASKEMKKITFDADFVEITTPTEFVASCPGNLTLAKVTVDALCDFPHFQFSTWFPDERMKNNWMHKNIKENYRKAGKNPIVLFGDSLTDNWRGKRFEYMKKNFNVVNAGIGGDTISGVLCRIDDMADLLRANPPVIVTFLIGTNDLNLSHTDRDIYAGIGNLVYRIHQLCPNTKIIVFGIPPRALAGRGKPYPYTENVNTLLRTIVPNNSVCFLDFSPLLLDSNTGKLKAEYYEKDSLHFSDRGYAEVITPFIAGSIRLLQAKNLPPNFIQQMSCWEKFLRARLAAAIANHGTEEELCCEYHLSTLPAFWLDTFAALEKDPELIPSMPAEYLRQQGQEGLPETFFGPQGRR